MKKTTNRQGNVITLGLAALLTLTSTLGGAYLYNRVEQQKIDNASMNHIIRVNDKERNDFIEEIIEEIDESNEVSNEVEKVVAKAISNAKANEVSNQAEDKPLAAAATVNENTNASKDDTPSKTEEDGEIDVIYNNFFAALNAYNRNYCGREVIPNEEDAIRLRNAIREQYCDDQLVRMTNLYNLNSDCIDYSNNNVEKKYEDESAAYKAIFEKYGFKCEDMNEKEFGKYSQALGYEFDDNNDIIDDIIANVIKSSSASSSTGTSSTSTGASTGGASTGGASTGTGTGGGVSTPVNNTEKFNFPDWFIRDYDSLVVPNYVGRMSAYYAWTCCVTVIQDNYDAFYNFMKQKFVKNIEENFDNMKLLYLVSIGDVEYDDIRLHRMVEEFIASIQQTQTEETTDNSYTYKYDDYSNNFIRRVVDGREENRFYYKKIIINGSVYIKATNCKDSNDVVYLIDNNGTLEEVKDSELKTQINDAIEESNNEPNEEIVEEQQNEEIVEEQQNEEIVEEQQKEEVVEEKQKEEVVEEQQNEEIVDEQQNEEIVDEQQNKEIPEEQEHEAKSIFDPNENYDFALKL